MLRRTKSQRQSGFLVGLALAVIVAGSVAMHAQVQAGRVVGTVYDPAKSVVPRAAVTVKETATNLVHQVTADASGDFVVTPLDPGVYSVSASAPGFQTVVKTGIELQVAESIRVDLDLKLGATTSQVTVRAETPLLNTESGTLGQVINNNQIVDLPLNGRGFYELARLTPGSAQLPGTGNVLRIRPEFINGTTISGIRGRMITYLLDGFDVTEQHQGGTYIQTSIDGLQEFKVQQNGYSAEYSRAGALLNATTRTGSNKYHGNLFEFLRNDKLDARNFFVLNREILKRNQFGGTVGGPMAIPKVYNGRDRMFFFFSYDATRERQGLVFNNIVPSAAMKSGDFSALCRSGFDTSGVCNDRDNNQPNPRVINQIYNPSSANRTSFAGNRIPQNQLSSQALFFNKFIPDPNSASGTAVFTPTRALGLDQFTVRVDRNLTSNHRAFFRWSFNNNRQKDPNAFPALGTVPLHTRGQNVAGSLTSNLGPNRINEFRVSYLPSSINLEAFLQGTDVNGQAGIRGFEDTKRPGVAGAFPDFAWSGFASMNGSAFDQRPKTQDRQEYEFTDSLTWIKGRHILKFGGLVRHYQWLGTDSKQFVGQWSFTGINTENPNVPNTGSSFADWMLGLPVSGTRAFPGDTFGGLGTYWHFFVQDDVKLTKTLTLNIGMRYEYTPWLKGYRGQLGTFDPRSARPIIDASDTDQIDLGAQFAAPTAFPIFQNLIQTSHQAGLPINITSNDLRQWAPRSGFAWRPLGERTVVRGGYGIFYEPENTDGRVNLNMVPFKLDETATNTRGAVPTRTLADFFQGQPIGSLTSANPSLNPTPTQLRMGYDQHWNLGIQQQLGGNLIFELEYVGNKSTFLNSANPINDPPAGPGNIQQRRPYPRFGAITFNSQDTSSTYHALQFSAQKRYSSGLWFLASYTYSKALTRQQTTVAGGDSVFDKAISDIDIPHNFAYSFGYQLPFGKNKRFLNGSGRLGQGLIGGWQIQGILDLRNSLPFTPTVSKDFANIGVGGQRPTRLGSGNLSNPMVDRWFDITAFMAPANNTYGNSGRNILRANTHRDFDFSVFKSFPVKESSRLEFRAEFFNLMNTVTFGGPNTNIDLPATGGKVTSIANAPRQIQFALKYTF